jgi:hypothetical protein
MCPGGQGQQREACGTFGVDDHWELRPLADPLAPSQLDGGHRTVLLVGCANLKASTGGPGQPSCKDVELSVLGLAQMSEHGLVVCHARSGVGGSP